MGTERRQHELHAHLTEVFYKLANAREFAEEHRLEGTAADLEQLQHELIRIRGDVFPKPRTDRAYVPHPHQGKLLDLRRPDSIA